MSTKNEYLVYYIHLTDRALVDSLQSVTGTGGALGAVIMAPTVAAVTYSAPILGSGVPFTAPCITSDWFKTAPSYPTNVDTFSRKSGGLFGISWLFGDKTNYYWRGMFVLAPPITAPGTANPPTGIQRRRWIDGFELPVNGEGGSVPGQGEISRMASRHPDGFGLALRASTVVRTHLVNENIPGLTPANSWERFYIRVRGLPTVSTQFWRAHGSVSPAQGIALHITPTGQIAVFDVDSTGAVGSMHGTSATLALHVWYRVDLLHWWGLNAILYVDPPPAITLLVNGEIAWKFYSAVAPMGGNTVKHVSSEVGSPTANTLAIDIDDWVCADYPLVVAETHLTGNRNGLDWISGSHVQLINPTGLGASAGTWAGDWRTALQNPAVGAAGALTSSTAGDRLALTTDADVSAVGLRNSNGIAALLVAMRSLRTAGDGTLGYRVNGVDVGLTTILQGTVATWNQVLYPTTTVPIVIAPGFEVVHTKGAGVGASSVSALFAVAEVLGFFGPEDADLIGSYGAPYGPGAVPGPDPVPASTGPHNAPYPRTPWARATVAPASQPVSIKTGSYVGTGTGLELAFRFPVHFLWIRPATGDSGGVHWWSTLLSSHKALDEGVSAHLIPQALVDGTFVPLTTETLPAGDHADLVSSIKATLVARGVSLTGDCGAFEITKRVAWQLRATGWGLQYKPSGANCQSYAVAILIDAAGNIIDILGDAGGANTPQWIVGTPISPTLYRAAIDPGDVDGDTDPAGVDGQQSQTIVRLSGNDGQSNAVGVVYHYLAFMDPGMRFLLNGALTNHKGTANIVTALVNTGFLPLAGFFWRELLGGGATAGLFYKGPGHAAASLSVLNAAESITSLSWAAGAMTSMSAFHATNYQQVAFALFRKDDGSADAGLNKVVQIQSYIGDGAASRSFNLTPPSGKRPMWALIVPHNAASVMRDTGHTGTTSTTVPSTANAATGITGGGIDSISVGSALNANAVVYDVIAFPGSDVAGPGGWSPPYDNIPVDPNPPPSVPGGPYPPTDPDPPTGPTAPTDPDPPGWDPPSAPADPADDFGTVCKPFSQELINIALARIGYSGAIADVVADATPEAGVARLIYGKDVEAVLRDFAWPFATRHAILTLVASAPNRDWAYSYRQPTDCVFERRIVVLRNAALDPLSPPLALSSDATGGLIFTNEPNARLEYTARPVCTATAGDPLFLEALIWKLAASLAPAVSRIPGTRDMALGEYRKAIMQAELVLRPGNPGARPGASTLDTLAGADAANLEVANLALVRIGARTVYSLTADQSKEATAVRLVFEPELRNVLRDFPWQFAKRYLDPGLLVGGTRTAPVDGDWLYSFRAPTDMVFARRLVQYGSFRAFDADPPQFSTATDATGTLILTNQEDPVLEYTARVDSVLLMADSQFRDALAWRIAHAVALSVGRVEPDTPEQFGRGPEPVTQPKQHPTSRMGQRMQLQQYAWRMYQTALEHAKVASANEAQPNPIQGDAEWIRDRN